MLPDIVRVCFNSGRWTLLLGKRKVFEQQLQRHSVLCVQGKKRQQLRRVRARRRLRRLQVRILCAKRRLRPCAERRQDLRDRDGILQQVAVQRQGPARRRHLRRIHLPVRGRLQNQQPDVRPVLPGQRPAVCRRLGRGLQRKMPRQNDFGLAARRQWVPNGLRHPDLPVPHPVALLER